MIWLHNARIAAIFAVVFLHVAAGFVVYSPIGSDNWWIGNVYDSLVRWCVPVFVMISGALLLDPNKKEDFKTFYLKRLPRILIVTFVWSAFFLFWTFLRGDSLGVLDVAKRIIAGTPYFHLWFLYMIAPIYLFTPFFRKIISNSSHLEISILVIITLVIASLNAIAQSLGMVESKLFTTSFLSYVPYFFLGHLIRFGSIDYSKLILAISILLSVLLTSLGCYIFARNKGLGAGLYFYSYLSVTVIPMSASVMYLLKKWTKPIGNTQLSERLASLTLGIYLIHPVFHEVIQQSWTGYREINPIISIPLLSIIIFSSSLGAAWVIKKIPYANKTI